MSNEAPENAATEKTAPGQETSLHGQLPQVTFSTFVLSLSSSALVQLGEVPDPESGKNQENLLMAKHTIDILTMLQAKTKNNLDGHEQQMIDGLLYELRMKYVLKAK